MTERQFERKVEEARPQAMRTLARLGFKESTSEDAVSEAAQKAWTNRDKYNGRSRFASWFVSIAVNCAKDVSKSNGRHATADLTRFVKMSDPKQDPLAICVASEMVERIAAATAKLPPALRDVVPLMVEGLSYDEMGAILGVSNATVRSRIFDARRLLRMKLGTA